MPEPVRRRILVVDDDAGVREAMKGMLTDKGYEVATATNGQEALAVLRQGPRPDAIVLDLMMPVMTGMEFLDEKANDDLIRSVPVLIMTAHDQEPVRMRHVLGVFRKSRDLTLLFEALDRHQWA